MGTLGPAGTPATWIMHQRSHPGCRAGCGLGRASGRAHQEQRRPHRGAGGRELLIVVVGPRGQARAAYDRAAPRRPSARPPRGSSASRGREPPRQGHCRPAGRAAVLVPGLLWTAPARHVSARLIVLNGTTAVWVAVCLPHALTFPVPMSTWSPTRNVPPPHPISPSFTSALRACASADAEACPPAPARPRQATSRPPSSRQA